jgi:hypothetical protein
MVSLEMENRRWKEGVLDGAHIPTPRLLSP